MANKRISSLDDITLVGGTSTPGLTASDIIPVTDVSDTTGSIDGTTKKVTVANLVAVAPQGDLESANNLSDLADAATARTNLGVDAAGTDNSTDVTLDTTSHDYLSLTGQTVSLGAIDLAADVTGLLPNTSVSGLGTAATQDVGTSNGNVVQLDATGLPAVDGSQLTNVSGTDSTKLAIANNLSDLNDAATARTNLGLGTAATTASTDYATSAQGTLADSAVQPTDGIEALSNVSINNPADGSILKYVLANSQYEEASLGTASTADSSDFATAAQGALADTAVQPTDSIDVLADVDTSTVSPAPDDLLKWDGSNFVPGTVTVDVDTPLNTALRGTDNPHIGAYPNQSFKVIDNPYQSVMVVADEAGNLKLLNSLGVNNIAVGFSVVEDGVEPDIEVVSGSETYSVISGDSDSKGANGLPIRQGFNLPDIGANPAPILISGGSIA